MSLNEICWVLVSLKESQRDSISLNESWWGSISLGGLMSLGETNIGTCEVAITTEKIKAKMLFDVIIL